MRKKFIGEVHEIVISYKRTGIQKSHVANSSDSYEAVMELFDPDTIDLREEFYALFLNTRNNVVGYYPLSKGSLNATTVDPRLIFMAALKYPTRSIILTHNHPTGSSYPSDSDRIMTRRIVDAANLFDFKVLDHIIACSDGYYSFADEGLL